jgi:hypothetical protein
MRLPPIYRFCNLPYRRVTVNRRVRKSKRGKKKQASGVPFLPRDGRGAKMRPIPLIILGNPSKIRTRPFLPLRRTGL